MKINEIIAEGLGYSTDPEQGKWYHEGRKAHQGGTTSETGLIQDIARKHGCPPEWLDAFRAGYQDQEGWSKQEMSETTSSSGVATAMTGGNSPNVGTLFGGSFKPKTPFTTKKKAGKK